MTEYSEVYQAARRQDTPIPEMILGRVSGFFDDLRRLRLLDAGSGVGRVAIPVERHVSEVVCLDEDPTAIEILRGKNGAIPSVRGDVERGLPFDGGQFDVAVLSHVLHWLDRHRRAFSELYRVLRPGGLLLVFLYAPEDIPDRIKNRLGDPRLADVHRDLVPDTSNVRAELETVGFREVAVSKRRYERTYEKADLRRVVREVATGPLRAFRRRYGPEEYASLRERIDRRLAAIESGDSVREREVECCIQAVKGPSDEYNPSTGIGGGTA